MAKISFSENSLDHIHTETSEKSLRSSAAMELGRENIFQQKSSLCSIILFSHVQINSTVNTLLCFINPSIYDMSSVLKYSSNFEGLLT